MKTLEELKEYVCDGLTVRVVDNYVVADDLFRHFKQNSKMRKSSFATRLGGGFYILDEVHGVYLVSMDTIPDETKIKGKSVDVIRQAIHFVHKLKSNIQQQETSSIAQQVEEHWQSACGIQSTVSMPRPKPGSLCPSEAALRNCQELDKLLIRPNVFTLYEGARLDAEQRIQNLMKIKAFKKAIFRSFDYLYPSAKKINAYKNCWKNLYADINDSGIFSKNVYDMRRSYYKMMLENGKYGVSCSVIDAAICYGGNDMVQTIADILNTQVQKKWHDNLTTN